MADGWAHAMTAAGEAAGTGESLAERAARGDREAFAEIVAAHKDRVARVVYRLLGWSDDVEDVVQDVFATALENLPRFGGRSRLSTWLSAIAVNHCRSAWRRERLRRTLLGWLGGRRRDDSPSAEDTAIERETDRRVREAVRRLPMRLREVTVLRYLEELPVHEVAAVVGISRTVAATRLHRARRRLAKQLAGLAEE